MISSLYSSLQRGKMALALGQAILLGVNGITISLSIYIL
jgi:hypothetical protein